MDAYDFIEKTNELGSRLGLDSIKELLNRLGNPENQCNVVHIAGTNGKGSVFAFVEGMLKEGGYKVGRYISPTVFTYLERFQINGTYMQEETFRRLCKKVEQVYDQMEQEGCLLPTSFEVETAIAFLYFVEEKVDVVLLETGMGGRKDATNVVNHPLLFVFASISFDHMEFLGDTIPKIVHEKAGILRQFGNAVSYPMLGEAKNALEQECEQLNVTLTMTKKEQLQMIEMNPLGQRFVYKGIEYKTKLLGEYQAYNAATALEVVSALEETFPISLEERKAGLNGVSWPCRFEILEKDPYVVRDGAHNIDAIIQLEDTIKKVFPNRKYAFVVGVFRDKEHEKMFRQIMPLADACYAVTAKGPRGMDKQLLAKEINELGFACQGMDTVEEAVALAKKQVGENGVVVLFGSLSFIGCI